MVMKTKDVVSMLDERQNAGTGFMWRDASSESIGTGAPSFVSESWNVDGKQYNVRVVRSELTFRWRATLESNGKTVWRSSVQHDKPEQAIDELQKLACAE